MGCLCARGDSGPISWACRSFGQLTRRPPPWAQLYLAGLAVGFYKPKEEIASQRASDRKFEPTIGEDHRQRLHARWHKALERAKAWAE